MEERRKVYVEVRARHLIDGTCRPETIKFENDEVYEIDRVKQCCRAASTKVGGTGLRYELIHRLHFRSVKTEYSSQRLLIDKATFYEWLKSQTHYKIVEGKEDFNDRAELSEA